MADDLQAVVEEWNLAQKVNGITTDDAHNMVAARALLLWICVPCFTHTLQLVAKEGFKVPAPAEVLSSSRKIVGHFKIQT